MKKILFTLGLSTFLSLASTSVFAMPSMTSPEMSPCAPDMVSHSGCPCTKTDDCGETIKEDCPCRGCMDKKRDELYKRLNLDTCQRQEAKAIEDSYKSALDSHRATIKKDHKCLCQKIHAKCLDKQAVREQERVLKSDFKDLKRTMKSMDKEFKQVLKGCQKSEYRKIKREMKYRIKKSVKYCCKPAKCK